MQGTWIERARWEWTNLATGYLHEVWVSALVDDTTHEIQSWAVWTRLGGPGKGPKKTYFTVDAHGPQEARDRAYEAGRSYRAQYGGPAE